MATMLFYQNITPLNRETHRDLTLHVQSRDASFAAETHYVPLAGVEFQQAARDYPILFAGGEENAGPVALLGLRENENLFLVDGERWAPGSHVPAFVRRYPFVLADGGAGKDEYSVCIDDSYRGFSRDGGTPLFDEDGRETEYLGNTLAFINQFRTEMQRTQQFSKRLRELGLLIAWDIRVDDNRGQHFRLQGFRVIDESRLGELDDATVAELHGAGFLGWIHAHLISIGNLTRLPARMTGQAPADVPPARVNLQDA